MRIGGLQFGEQCLYVAFASGAKNHLAPFRYEAVQYGAANAARRPGNPDDTVGEIKIHSCFLSIDFFPGLLRVVIWAGTVLEILIDFYVNSSFSVPIQPYFRPLATVPKEV